MRKNRLFIGISLYLNVALSFSVQGADLFNDIDDFNKLVKPFFKDFITVNNIPRLYQIGIEFYQRKNSLCVDDPTKSFILAYQCFQYIVKNFLPSNEILKDYIRRSYYYLGVCELQKQYYFNAAANFGTSRLLGLQEAEVRLRFMVENNLVPEDYLIFIRD